MVRGPAPASMLRGMGGRMLFGCGVLMVEVDVDCLTDEHCRQKRKDKRLEEGDEQFEEVDGDAAEDDGDGDGDAAEGAHAVPGHADEGEQDGEEHVSGDHVCEETHGQGEGLGE